MAQSYRSRFLSVQKQNEAALKALFAQLARDIASEVTDRADADGNVPRSATFDIQQAMGELVRKFFLGRTRTGEWAPFDTVGNGALIPLSPYMRQLWESIKAAARIPVEQNAAILANKLPVDVLTLMRSATRNPFPVAKAMVAEQVFRPNPLAVYDAPHEWVDPNGYRLSDRVWNVAALERRRLDLYLDTAIREGRGALTMSRELESFLIPGRSLPATSKPYGTTASFDAMRLARTEISQAHQRASVVSAAMNPFVSGMKWNLSASHPRIDICDDLARGGPNGDGVYPIEGYPGRPHPNCICYSTNVLIGDPDAMIDQLRADVQAAKREFTDLVGPLEVERFTQLLLGQGLTVERTGVASRVIAPPIVVQPVVRPVIAPPVVTSPPPVDLAADARRQIIEANQRYETQLTQIETEIERIERQLQRAQSDVDRLERAGGQPLREARNVRNRYLDERRALEDEHKRLYNEQATRLRSFVYVDRPARVTMNADEVDASTIRVWQRGLGEFNNLVSADVAPARTVNFIDSPRKRSSYNPETKFLRLNEEATERVVVHELGHWLEDHNPDLQRKVFDFYKRRTQGYPLEPLGAPGGYFRNDEFTRRDKFLDTYMGKEYAADGQLTATEIVSMGVEFFYNRPVQLATEDPEMFDFIFNLLRGR